MNKKLLITSILLMIIGLVGFVPSTVLSIPYFTGVIEEARNNRYIEKELYKNNKEISEIIISTKYSDIELFTHDKDEVIVKRIGNEENLNYNIDEKGNELLIKENKIKESLNIRDLNVFVDQLANKALNHNTQKLAVYLPKGVNINVSTFSGNLTVEDSQCLGKELSFNTEYGNLILPKEVKSMDRLNILSNGSLNLRLPELLGIKEVVIVSKGYLNIRTDVEDSLIDNSIENIPQVLNISSVGTVDINTNMPIAKNTIINQENGDINIDLPIQMYNINFDLYTKDGTIKIGDEEVLNKYKGKLYELGGDKEYNLNASSKGYINVYR